MIRKIAKLICGTESGNAVLINQHYALTVKHCIEQYINTHEEIKLYCYNGHAYKEINAHLADCSTDGDGFAILELHCCEWSIDDMTFLEYDIQPYERFRVVGFDRNHTEKPSWRMLNSISSSDLRLRDEICDMVFVDDTKEKSVTGLSGSPILLNGKSNAIIGLVCQQKTEGGQQIEICGISVSSQANLLKKYNFNISLKPTNDEKESGKGLKIVAEGEQVTTNKNESVTNVIMPKTMYAKENDDYDVFITYYGNDNNETERKARQLCRALNSIENDNYRIKAYCKPKDNFADKYSDTLRIVQRTPLFLLVVDRGIPTNKYGQLLEKNAKGGTDQLYSEVGAFKSSWLYRTAENIEMVAKLYIIGDYSDGEFVNLDPIFTGTKHFQEQPGNFTNTVQSVADWILSVVYKDKPTVFISYNSNMNDYVDGLEKALRDHAQIIRYTHQDSTGVGPWKSFRDFMKTIREQDFAVLIISKEFLKSDQCIYEVMQLWKDEKSWDEKVMYVVTDDAGIYSPLGRIEYIKYWQSVFERYVKEISDVSITNASSVAEQARLYQMYAANIGEFLEKVADSNNPSNENAAKNILDRIHKKEHQKKLY